MATPTSSQDDRCRPFIVVRLVSGQRHVKHPRSDVPVVPSTYSSDRLTPHAGGIRDGVHPRVAPPPPCPGSASAHSAARAHLWPTLSVSGSRCSSRRSSTESPADASHRLPRYGPDIRVESSQSRAQHRRFATAIVAL